jgi:hypothetical protein
MPESEESVICRTRKFLLNRRVKMFRDGGGEPVDEGIVSLVSNRGPVREITVSSLKLYPQESHRFAYLPRHGGWKMVFIDCMTGRICYSGKKGPVYRFEPA